MKLPWTPNQCFPGWRGHYYGILWKFYDIRGRFGLWKFWWVPGWPFKRLCFWCAGSGRHLTETEARYGIPEPDILDRTYDCPFCNGEGYKNRTSWLEISNEPEHESARKSGGPSTAGSTRSYSIKRPRFLH
jgi:hypothetical protein